MEELKQFFIQNWQLLASALLFIIATIIGIVTKKKKGYTFSDILLGLIAEQLPLWISTAESTAGATGEQKKVAVLNSALNYASKTLGRKLSEEETSFIIAQASEQIEKILTTPQKKEAKAIETKKGSKYR